MEIDREIHALRHSVALSELSHVACLRLSGRDVFDALDAVVPLELHLVDGQMRHTLLLGEDGRPLVDLFVCCDDEDYLLMAEGLSPEALIDHLRTHFPAELEVEMEDLGHTHALLSLNGPYAWEALSTLVGPEVIGVPYLSFFRTDGWTCFRAGKTGEYGYDLLVPKEGLAEMRAKILEAGAPLDLREAGLETLEQCALENWFFNIRREGRGEVTPLELQLQWRVSYRKEYVGSEALKQRRRAGIRSRLTALVSEAPLRIGDEIRWADRVIGQVVNAGFSSVRGDWVGMALIERHFAQPGVERYVIDGTEGPQPIKTLSAPLLNNRSLHVDPRRHSYLTRGEDVFPKLF